ncbi:MAG: hypothetical protein R3E08_10200 [Thiotrichaceae bacterium]
MTSLLLFSVIFSIGMLVYPVTHAQNGRATHYIYFASVSSTSIGNGHMAGGLWQWGRGESAPLTANGRAVT